MTAEDEDGSNPEQSLSLKVIFSCKGTCINSLLSGDREQSRATSGILCCYRPGAVTTRLCCMKACMIPCHQ